MKTTTEKEGPSPVTKEISHQSEVQTTQKQAVNNQESSKPQKDPALFRCAHCEKTFTKSINLQYHTYRHTGNVFALERKFIYLFLDNYHRPVEIYYWSLL